MSKFYGTVRGERSAATRTGHRSISASAQSWDGSITTELTYESNDKLMVRVLAEKACSTTGGQTVFYGTYDEYIKKLKS